MRPSRASKAIVLIEPSGSRITKPARPFIVAGRNCIAENQKPLRAMPAKKRKMILSAS
jgi:hypothetical protein